MCGYAKCAAALTFHHEDPTQKDFPIGGSALKWGRLKVELDKTVLLCMNCHAEVHYEEDERARSKLALEIRQLVPTTRGRPKRSHSEVR